MFNSDDFRLISGFGVSILSSAEGIASLMKYILANSLNPFLDQPFLRAPVLKLNRNSQMLQQTDYNIDNDSDNLTHLFDILSLSRNFNKLFTPVFVVRIPVPVKTKFKKEIANPNLAIITNYIIPLIKSALAEQPDKISKLFEILIEFVNSNTTISNDTDIAYSSGISNIIYQGLMDNNYEPETLEIILNAWVKLIAQFGSSIDCYLLAKIWLKSPRQPLLDLSELAKSIDYTNPPRIAFQPRPRCKRKPLIHFLSDLSIFKFTLSGGYIYAISQNHGLIKIGTGFNGTVTSSIVNQNTTLIGYKPHFICVYKDTIIIKLSQEVEVTNSNQNDINISVNSQEENESFDENFGKFNFKEKTQVDDSTEKSKRFYLMYLDLLTLEIKKEEETTEIEPFYSHLCCTNSYLYKLDQNGLMTFFTLNEKTFEFKTEKTKQTQFNPQELTDEKGLQYTFTNGFNFYIHSANQIYEISLKTGELRCFTIPEHHIMQYRYIFDSKTGQYFLIDDKRLAINSDEKTFYYLDLPQKKYETPLDILHFLVYSHETISKGYSISPSFDIFIDMIDMLIPIQSSEGCQLAPVFLECSIQSLKAGNLIPMKKMDVYMKRANYFLRFYKIVFLRFLCKFIQCGDSNYQSDFLEQYVKQNDQDHDKIDIDVIFEASASIQCFQSVYLFRFLIDEYWLSKIWRLFDVMDHKAVSFLNVLSESLSYHLTKTPILIVKLIKQFMNIVHFSPSPLFISFLQSFFDVFHNSLDFVNDSTSFLHRILPHLNSSRTLSELNWYNFRLFYHFPLVMKEKSSVSVSSHLFELELPVQGAFQLTIQFEKPINNKMLNVVIYTTKSQREHVYYLPSTNELVTSLRRKFVSSYIAVDLNLKSSGENETQSEIVFYYSLDLTLPIVGATETLMNLNIIQLYWTQSLFKCEQLFSSNQIDIGSKLFTCVFEYIPVDLFHKVYKKFNSVDVSLFQSNENLQIIRNKIMSENFNESLFYLSIASRIEEFDFTLILERFKKLFEQFSVFVFQRKQFWESNRQNHQFYIFIRENCEIQSPQMPIQVTPPIDLHLNCYINFHDFVSYVQNELLFIIHNCSQKIAFYNLFIEYISLFNSQTIPVSSENLIVYLKCLLQFPNKFFSETDLTLIKTFILNQLPIVYDLQLLFFYEKVFQKLNLKITDIDTSIKTALNSVIIRQSALEEKFYIQMCQIFRKFMTVDAFNGLSAVISNTNGAFVNENGDFFGPIVGALLILSTRHSPLFINDKYVMTSKRRKSIYYSYNANENNDTTKNESTENTNEINKNDSTEINTNESTENTTEINQNELMEHSASGDVKNNKLNTNEISFNLQTNDYLDSYSEFTSNIYELHNFNKIKINLHDEINYNEYYQEHYGYNYKDFDSVEMNLLDYSPLLFTFETDDKSTISHPPFDFNTFLTQMDNIYYKRIPKIEPLPKLSSKLINSVLNKLDSELKPLVLDALTDLTINSPISVDFMIKKFTKLGFYEKLPLIESSLPSIAQNSSYYIQFEKPPAVNYVNDTNFSANTIADMQNDFQTIENKRKKFKVSREFSVFLRKFFSSKHKEVNVYSYDQPSFNFSLMLSRYEKYKLLLNDDHNREICIWSITDNFISTVLPGNNQPIIECLFGISIEFQVVYLKMQSHFWVNPIQYFTPNKIVRLGIVGTEKSFDAFVEDEPPEFLTAASRPYLLLIDHSLKSLEFSNRLNLNSDVTFLPFIKNEKQVFFMEIVYDTPKVTICLSPSFLTSLTFFEYELSGIIEMGRCLLIIDFKQRKIIVQGDSTLYEHYTQPFDYLPYVCLSLKIARAGLFQFNFGHKNVSTDRIPEYGLSKPKRMINLNNDKRIISSYKFNPSIYTPFKPSGWVFPKEIGRPSFLNFNSMQIPGSLTNMSFISMNLKIPFESFMFSEIAGKSNSKLFERSSTLKGNYSFFSSQPLPFPLVYKGKYPELKKNLNSNNLNGFSYFYNDDKYNHIFHDMFLVSTPFDSIDNVEIATVHSLFFLRDKLNQTYNIDFSRLCTPSLFDYNGSFCNPHNMTLKNMELNIQRKSEIIINVFSQIPNDQLRSYFNSPDTFYSQLLIQAINCLSELDLRTDYPFSNLLFKLIELKTINPYFEVCGNIEFVKKFLAEAVILFTDLHEFVKNNGQYQIIHAHSVGNFERICDLDCDLLLIKQTKMCNSKNKIKLVDQNQHKLILKTYTKGKSPNELKVNYNCIQTYLRGEIIFDRIGFMDAILCTLVPINFKHSELIQINKGDEHCPKSVGHGFSIHFINHLVEYIKKSEDKVMANIFHKNFLLPVYHELVYHCSAVFDSYVAKWLSILITHRHLFSEKALIQYCIEQWCIKSFQFDQCPYDQLSFIARLVNIQSEIMFSKGVSVFENEELDAFIYSDIGRSMSDRQEISEAYFDINNKSKSPKNDKSNQKTSTEKQLKSSNTQNNSIQNQEELIKRIQNYFLLDHSFSKRQIVIYKMIAADLLNPLGSHFPFLNSITNNRIIITHPILQELLKWRPDFRPDSYSINLLSPQFPIQHKIRKDSIPIVCGITPKSFRIDVYNDDESDNTYSIISNNSNTLLSKHLKVFYLHQYNSLPNFALISKFHHHLAILKSKWSIRDEAIAFFINNLLAVFKIDLMNFMPFSNILEKIFPNLKPETASIQLMLTSFRYRTNFAFHSPYENDMTCSFLNEISVDYMKFNKKTYTQPIIKQKVRLPKQMSHNCSPQSSLTSTIQKFDHKKLENQRTTFSEVYLKLSNYLDFIFKSNYNEIESLNKLFNDELTDNDLFVRNPITKIYAPAPEAMMKRQLDAFVAFGSHLVVSFESQIQLPIVVSRVVLRFAFDHELILDDFGDFDPDFAVNGNVNDIPMKIKPIKKQLEAIRLGVLKMRPIKYHSYFAFSWYPRVVQMMPFTDVLKMLNENKANQQFIVMKSVELIVKNLEENGNRELLDFNCLI